ncbi:hypothetical protein [Sulfurovum sp.]|uniref:hypothetical protein n=1 Tax=Sulfurovum sp. TaxID=1969726 RepID=UPI0035667B68
MVQGYKIKYLLIFILLIFSQIMMAEECIFDKTDRVNENIKLLKRYPGSYMTNENLVVQVPVADGEVSINIGGCVHFGIMIELKIKDGKHTSEDEFMNKILWLAQAYSQGMIDQKRLEKVIKERIWTKPTETEKFYFFNYDGSPFEVYERRDDQHTVVGFMTYD